MPACLHQDCVSFLAKCVEDAKLVWGVCHGFDKEDHFAKLLPQSPKALTPKNLGQHRFKFGIPPASALEVCSPEYRHLFEQCVQTLKQEGTLVDMYWEPFQGANDLLYNGSFVSERLTILPDGWFDKNKQSLHPVTRQVFEIAQARNSTAVDVFKDLHKQARCKREVEDILTYDEEKDELTVMIVPTAPFHPTIQEVASDPIKLNTALGAFAHFANVLDLTGIATPCGDYGIEETVDGRQLRLPFGITILAGAGLDAALLGVAARLEEVLMA